MLRFCCVWYSILWLTYTIQKNTWIDSDWPFALYKMIRLDKCILTGIHPKRSLPIPTPWSANHLCSFTFLRMSQWGHTGCSLFNWILSLSHMHRRFIPVFQGLMFHSFPLLSVIPLHVYRRKINFLLPFQVLGWALLLHDWTHFIRRKTEVQLTCIPFA